MELTNIKHNWRSEFQRLEGAYAPATMRSYRADVEAYENWCGENHCFPFPASVETVCRFLQDQGIKRAPSTVRRRLYAIRKVHLLTRGFDTAAIMRVDCWKSVNVLARYLELAEHNVWASSAAMSSAQS